MKRIPVVIFILAVVMGLARTDLAALDDQYYPIMKADEDMRSSETKKDMVSSGFQYGAWITPVIIYQETPQPEFIPSVITLPMMVPPYVYKKDTLATSVTTFRVWFKTYLWENSYLYARGKDTYTAVIDHKGPAESKDKNVLDLDLGYISMSTPRKEFNFAVGRKYFLLGSGTVLDGRGDGAEINVNTKYINIKALGTWTGWLSKDDNPYGLSDRDISTGAKRVFAGGSLSTSWYNQTIYAFGLAQFDFGKQIYDSKKIMLLGLADLSDGTYDDTYSTYMQYYNQKSRYQSQYYGAGLDGVIASGLTYSGEFIAEMGKSYSYDPLMNNMRSMKDILAFAGLAKVEYFIDVTTKPVITAQYAFGSGDTNRDSYRSPTGNRYGTDSGFLYFGTFVGGYALKPLLGNMHVISGSVALSPFSWVKIESFKNMTLIGRYLYYLKNKAQAAINNGLDATRNNREIGHGVDASLRWQIFSDFSFFANYGVFIPGNSYGYSARFQYTLTPSATVTPTPVYSSRQMKHFLMVGLNVSF